MDAVIAHPAPVTSHTEVLISQKDTVTSHIEDLTDRVDVVTVHTYLVISHRVPDNPTRGMQKTTQRLCHPT